MRDPFPLTQLPRLTNAFRPLSNYIGLQTLPFHVHEIAAGYVIYESLFRVLSPRLSSYFAPKHYNKLDRRGKINWNAHVVSMVQSCLINGLALYVIAKDPARGLANAPGNWRERLWGYNGGTGMVQGLAAGYFIWDVVVSLSHMDVMGPGSLAHAIAALGVTLLGFKPFANYYGLNFILYELSTPFLNIHWFCDKVGMTGSQLQLYNGFALLFSFFGSRLVWGSYQSLLIYGDVWKAWIDTTPSTAACEAYRLLKDGSFQMRQGLDVPLECRVLPKWLAILYVTANTVLGGLNFYWFAKMVSAVRKRFVKQTDQDGSRKGDVNAVKQGKNSIPKNLTKEMEPGEGKDHLE